MLRPGVWHPPDRHILLGISHPSDDPARHRTFEIRATYNVETGDWSARVGEQNLNEQRGDWEPHRVDTNDAPRFLTAAACLGDAVTRLMTMVDQEAHDTPWARTNERFCMTRRSDIKTAVPADPRGLFMPRYEIVVHVTRELDCASAEEAATEFRRQLLADAGLADALLHLAVWREDPTPAASPLPSSLRRSLEGFFAALERCAGEAEEAFRGRVEAILMGPTPAAGDVESPQSVPAEGTRPE
jgi:hypothetical protein